jgi:hypothetical protein
MVMALLFLVVGYDIVHTLVTDAFHVALGPALPLLPALAVRGLLAFLVLKGCRSHAPSHL